MRSKLSPGRFQRSSVRGQSSLYTVSPREVVQMCSPCEGDSLLQSVVWGNSLLLSKVKPFSTSQLSTSLLVSFAQGQGPQTLLVLAQPEGSGVRTSRGGQIISKSDTK